jgi:trehalose 6-phosphate synthase
MPGSPSPADANSSAGQAQFVVVANRLPVHAVDHGGSVEWATSPGGLVAALAPVLREHGGTWIGWSGGAGTATVPSPIDGIALRAVELSDEEYQAFYLGFANATLWPLYHDAIRPATFEREWWNAYVTVNRRFAEAAAHVAAPGATAWIHDYQLQLVPAMLRDLRPDLRIGFFLHIPFPPQELFMQLPWRREILKGLLGADLVGFQVPGAAANFSRLTRRLLGTTGTDASTLFEDRQVKVGAFPISVDTSHLISRATDPHVVARAAQLRKELGDPEFVMLGVDRLDYTKGIDRRLRAIGELFNEGTLQPTRHVMVQIAVPSREADPHYQREREELERLVSGINGEHATVGNPAVHYLHQSVPFDELVALYLAADLMLVTPLRDGMNLVAKEYVACRMDGSGSLVLSEFAGAAHELNRAILVNPHDLDDLKRVISDALESSPAEAKGRMRRLQRVFRRHDVHAWAQRFLESLRQTSPQA